MTHPSNIDVLIVGQGLAGTILALTLEKYGLSYRIIYDAQKAPASAIAAGLLNPITGKRLAKAPLMDAYLDAAKAFYPLQEKHLAAPFFKKRSFVRLLKSKEEGSILKKRLEDPSFQPYIPEVHPPHYFDYLQDEWGSFAVDNVYTLDVPLFLEKAKAYFEAKGCLLSKPLRHPVNLANHELHWEGSTFKSVIFCEGHSALENPLFSWLPFRPAKGEILSLDLLQGLPDVIINKEKWLIPIGPTRLKLGATYSWEDLHSGPTISAKAELLDCLRDILHVSYFPFLLKHEAAVRPCTEDAQPFIGHHPLHPSLCIFNGFGSRGTLLIPFYAECLAKHLIHQAPLPKEADIRRYLAAYSAL